MKSELQIACDELNIRMESQHIGIDMMEGASACDRWKCELYFETRGMVTEFKTGFGHRKLVRGARKSFAKIKLSDGDMISEEEAIKQKYLIPSPPESADVISCLLSDMSALDNSFKNWAGEFGYSNDSLKALTIYLACQNNSDKLICLLGHKIIQDLRSKKH